MTLLADEDAHAKLSWWKRGVMGEMHVYRITVQDNNNN